MYPGETRECNKGGQPIEWGVLAFWCLYALRWMGERLLAVRDKANKGQTEMPDFTDAVHVENSKDERTDDSAGTGDGYRENNLSTVFTGELLQKICVTSITISRTDDATYLAVLRGLDSNMKWVLAFRTGRTPERAMAEVLKVKLKDFRIAKNQK